MYKNEAKLQLLFLRDMQEKAHFDAYFCKNGIFLANLCLRI